MNQIIVGLQSCPVCGALFLEEKEYDSEFHKLNLASSGNKYIRYRISENHNLTISNLTNQVVHLHCIRSGVSGMP
jgi:hypothetical protein